LAAPTGCGRRLCRTGDRGGVVRAVEAARCPRADLPRDHSGGRHAPDRRSPCSPGGPAADDRLAPLHGSAGPSGTFLWFVVPTATHQVNRALASASSSDVRTARSSGIEHTILVALKRQLAHLPPPSRLVGPLRSLTTTALEVLAGIFFTFAVATYWIFERDRAIGFTTSLLPPAKRRVARETWLLIDLRLGAYVRGVLLLVLLVSTVLSACFWLLGIPYWLLLGPFAGVVELLPVIGPLVAGATAVGAALTVSWQLALKTAAVFYGLRLVQDYLVNPRVLGGIVELSPLVVLVSVAGVGILIGPAAVPLATPFAAVLATLLDVIVRGRDPESEDPPTVILPTSEPP
jgi:predicted PurR-regulated permease PerM